ATEAWNTARHRSAGERATRLFQLGFDHGPDRRQAFRGRGLEPEHERGLGVGGLDHSPPVIEDHSDPVDRDDLANRRSRIATRPDISPASTAPSAFILALISEWPVFHMIGRPPCFWMSSYRPCEALTSEMIVLPGRLARMSREYTTIRRSPQRILPFSSTAPIRSASPSYPMPTSAPVFFTVLIRSWRLSTTVGSGWWLGNRPSNSQKRPVTRHPNCSTASLATSAAAPLPQSMTT